MEGKNQSIEKIEKQKEIFEKSNEKFYGSNEFNISKSTKLTEMTAISFDKYGANK